MKLIKPGILSTFQDLGRNGYRYLGINPNGAMDKTAVRLLNILLQNPEEEATLEIHFPAPEIAFEQDAIIAIGGADFTPMLNNQVINNWQTIIVSAGSILKFSKRNTGQRAYIALKGGFDIPQWLGSKSNNIIINPARMKAGDRLRTFHLSAKTQRFYLANDNLPVYATTPTIRITQGNEYPYLNEESRQLLERQSFMISQNSNRMGFRLSASPLKLQESRELISSAVDFGTIQLLPDGQLIVLMADHQTTGGYPRMGNVISVDLPVLAQCGTNDHINFQIISLEQAEEQLFLREKKIAKLKASIQVIQNNTSCKA